ncbi:tRNA(His) guanylyltransferase Thg1 family protein [Kutzneria buriramensis]|uniref:tRNA(His) guanylyltransferase n=1 Tax=Kutzneria buriramensis TaxID=1045776 RepID=A0A3E0HYN5_9PSEU|nr:tRNA(His) guanylyltransferase Thg1 family protein [Kutzneria buriramensis]REH51583.1 tRNA(His) 5'-end guanylyltransferase [Kutzneria buriramensis]
MRGREFEARQREREWFHGLVVPRGSWPIIRVDGRGFSNFTEERFDKPFDERFSRLMVDTARAMLTEFGARYVYTESDEISLLLPADTNVFGRGVEKIVSLTAGLASAVFTHGMGEPATFDSRIWLGNNRGDVLDYFSWRQADATRCALNGWCYWTLRKAGRTSRQADKAIEGKNAAAKNELLYEEGINFNEVPAWQRRGIGLWLEEFERPGHDPITGEDVVATRRRVRVERELPMKDDYRAFLTDTVKV